MKKIIVCMKQVPDPETSASNFKIDEVAKQAIQPKGVSPVLNPFDENALEAALQIKDTQEVKITVLSMGRKLDRTVVRASLEVGADELILLEGNTLENFDSFYTSFVLAAAIKKIGDFDIILCGRQASDTNNGQVGSVIAEILGIPIITIARKIDILEGKVKVEREITDGFEVAEAPIPVLITAGRLIGTLREPSIEGFVAAEKKPINVWSIGELGIDLTQLKRINFSKLSMPIRDTKCQMIKANSPEESGVNLALKLRENKIL